MFSVTQSIFSFVISVSVGQGGVGWENEGFGVEFMIDHTQC